MIGEIWTYLAPKPNNNKTKGRPVLVIGDDSLNELKYVDILYVLISSSAKKGKYDVEISEEESREIGLDRCSIIKTTKIYTGSKTFLNKKIGDLPEHLKLEFIEKYREYQNEIISILEETDTEKTE